jgi:endonuclease/exonuclease/phosphatase family metal-dependent hydrolase
MRFLNGGAARVATLIVWAAMFVPHLSHAQTGSTLKVLDWNTHHGVGSDGVYDLQRFVTWIARSGAQVVSLNEVEKRTSWGNEDQPARYAALLKSATGKTWHYAFAQRDGGTNGQGNLILSTFPIEAADGTTLSHSRSVARAQIVVNGVRVNVFSTHLDADSGARRAEQMAELKNWAAGFSQQHIIAGDFNAWPGAAEIANMTAFAHDAWATAKARGLATAYAGNEAGNTRNSRIDYIWYSKSATKLVLKAAQVFDTRDSGGDMPSDHRPVMATFQVGAATTVADDEPAKVTADFDGDRKADVSLYRPSTGEWFALRSGGAGVLQVAWGAPSLGDIPVSGDYDGDGRSDIAVFRPTDGTWYIRYTSNGAGTSSAWGNWADTPAPADYDGDGRDDVAVFRPSDGTWYVRHTGTGTMTGVQWGSAGDVPVAGDYDGDGKADVAVFRPANGVWYVRHSSTGRTSGTQWGNGADVPVPGDYDGDGKNDLAVFRPANGTWYVRYSSTGGTFGFQWGNAADRPAAGDYDGDGKTDLAVFRPSNGVWYQRHSSTGALTGIQWGHAGDLPLLSR